MANGHVKQTLTGPLSTSLNENVSNLKSLFDSCDDCLFQFIKVRQTKGCLVYFANLVNTQKLNEVETRLTALFQDKEPAYAATRSSFIERHFPFQEVQEMRDWSNVIESLLSGKAVLLIDHSDAVLYFDVAESVGRETSEPELERTVAGPKEGFVENMAINLHLIRNKIKTPALKVKQFTIGTRTQTTVTVLYINGIADDGLVNEIHNRLNRIEIDGVLDTHYLESMISDAPYSPFPTLLTTDRPDRVAASLLEGKAAILVDGAPSALLAPVVFVECLHSSEDYYNNAIISTIIRWVRFLGLFVVLILPPFYVAVTTFHQDLLQTPLLIRIAANRANLPYPALIEALFMYLTYELLREAGLRMPKLFGGPIVTILGLILISQAAVRAGIIGPIMAIVVATTALTAFILPNYRFHQVVRFCGIPLLLLAGFFGFMGILVGLMFGLTHLVSLRSFGVPYFSPVSPARKEGWKDVFIRAPWWAMDTRPPGIGALDTKRSGDTLKPNPPKQKEETYGKE
ncbi:spore germination protein [Pullulanibacillus sp. KACC 23026]|uniref:spore germination protein n=1 Tax=Pullulanibacillus sp. KACC 23026 TaxID=3028315 RepID=UPI0023B06B65|nr:spore germination protein [Pullulanibacillus sp. KACC 23026]WEG14651.1 spore germination protein [Pullulanibacillus sp. KACC 23026]